jgi:hypothetical protein
LDEANFAQKVSSWGVHYDYILHGFLKPSIVHLFTSITKFIEGGRQKHTLFRTDNKRREAIFLISRKHVGTYECQGFVSREQKTL